MRRYIVASHVNDTYSYILYNDGYSSSSSSSSSSYSSSSS